MAKAELIVGTWQTFGLEIRMGETELINVEMLIVLLAISFTILKSYLQI
jgi:hypothetical protein